jgi:hypothetical protein
VLSAVKMVVRWGALCACAPDLDGPAAEPQAAVPRQHGTVLAATVSGDCRWVGALAWRLVSSVG